MSIAAARAGGERPAGAGSPRPAAWWRRERLSLPSGLWKIDGAGAGRGHGRAMAARGLSAEARQGLALIAPPLGYALLLLAAPLATILAYSFFKDGYLTVIRELTTENYRGVWSDPIFHTIMLRSVIVSALVTLVTVVLAFPVAYFLSFGLAPRQKALWLFLITIPF